MTYIPGSGSGAPADATYITQVANAGLSAEQAMSALGTGIVKNTTTTGVQSVAVEGTDYYKPGGTDVAVADGGTGVSTAGGALTALGAEAVANKDTDTTLAANSDTKYASQKAIKTYADTKVPATRTVNGHALSANVTVTPTDIGLGSVDNTSDAAKPVSTAAQTALDLKVDENGAITGATKTKITYDTKGLVTAGADATTADIADSSNKRYVTDAQLVVIGNTSGTNTGDQALSDATISTTDITTNNVSTAKHGFAPKGDGDTAKFLNANGAYSTPSASVADGDKGDITVSSSGTVWTVDNDAVTYARMQNVSATDKLLGRSTAGSGDVEEIPLTAAGRAIIDDADATAQRATLGLGTIATQAANSVAISGGSVTGITDLAVADGGTGASTAAAARTNLGTFSVMSGVIGGNVATGATTYFAPSGGAVNAAEANRKVSMPFPGTLQNFYVYTNTAQSAGGTLVLTVQVNGLPTSIVITIAASAASGTFSDTTHTAAVVAGDTVSIKMTNNGSGTSATIQMTSLGIQ